MLLTSKETRIDNSLVRWSSSITHESTSDIRVRVANQTNHELAKSLIFASQVPSLRERFVDQRNIHWPREKGERVVAKKKQAWPWKWNQSVLYSSSMVSSYCTSLSGSLFQFKNVIRKFSPTTILLPLSTIFFSV